MWAMTYAEEDRGRRPWRTPLNGKSHVRAWSLLKTSITHALRQRRPLSLSHNIHLTKQPPRSDTPSDGHNRLHFKVKGIVDESSIQRRDNARLLPGKVQVGEEGSLR